MSNEGFIYCLSNPSLKDGLYKIGMTDKNPVLLAKELSHATSIAAPFKVEIAKKVNNPSKKEKHIHYLLDHYENRYRLNRDFFEVKLEVVKAFFELLDREEWGEQEKEKTNKNRDMMRDYFKDNQRKIRHKFGKDKIIVGLFNYEKNCIVYRNNEFNSFSDFAAYHHDIEEKNGIYNEWSECEVEIDNKWIRVKSL
jgi:hypothetical protein